MYAIKKFYLYLFSRKFISVMIGNAPCLVTMPKDCYLKILIVKKHWDICQKLPSVPWQLVIRLALHFIRRRSLLQMFNESLWTV